MFPMQPGMWVARGIRYRQACAEPPGTTQTLPGTSTPVPGRATAAGHQHSLPGRILRLRQQAATGCLLSYVVWLGIRLWNECGWLFTATPCVNYFPLSKPHRAKLKTGEIQLSRDILCQVKTKIFQIFYLELSSYRFTDFRSISIIH